jgi:hypothetical protein
MEHIKPYVCYIAAITNPSPAARVTAVRYIPDSAVSLFTFLVLNVQNYILLYSCINITQSPFLGHT